MHIHRSRHTRGFTVLPNTVLQDRRLSYTARGLLADLLSRPDGWREDGRHMADTSPQGRCSVAKALRELTAHGYYRVERVRRPDGTFVSEAHVYDTPQRASAPSARFPGPGHPASDGADFLPVKNRKKEPTLPARRRPEVGGHVAGAGGRTTAPTTGTSAAAALLHRVIGPEPRLRLGVAETASLVPLVTAWVERGYGQRDLAGALLGGLPEHVHSAVALLRDRLVRKLPPAREAVGRPRHPYECTACARPVPAQGICRTCAGHDTPRTDAFERAGRAGRGRALVRAALASHRPEALTRA
ncbi:hypothetical protein ABZ832_18650 [Streptantibioticus parmotrematis]|uniref:hypothetical protein n=1 Tax=Streptantibioticus parmotrematis TaxID=2873249 RepID=UPI0034077284